MAADRRLTEAFRPLAEALLPDRVLSQERSVSGAINDDATVRPESLTAALPWNVRDVFLAGDVPEGANIVRLAMPQGGRIRHIGISARTVASGGPLALRVSVDGVSESFSLAEGVTYRATGLSAPLVATPGSLVAISVVSANGAANVTISLHYQVGG